MKVNNSVLTLDIKIEDKFRELLANLDKGMPKLKGVILGDSDIDYQNLDIKNSRIHNAPYNINKVKYPLIYAGGEKGVEGYITVFLRKVVDTTEFYDPSIITSGPTIYQTCRIDSMYDYPTTSIFTNGGSPPVLGNGFDWDMIDFENNKMGYLVYFQVILLNYYDKTTNLPLRFNEKLDIKVEFNNSEIIPAGWRIIKDIDQTSQTFFGKTYNVWHNSMFICKEAFAVAAPTSIKDGLITVTGTTSNITKKIKFNI